MPLICLTGTEAGSSFLSSMWASSSLHSLHSISRLSTTVICVNVLHVGHGSPRSAEMIVVWYVLCASTSECSISSLLVHACAYNNITSIGSHVLSHRPFVEWSRSCQHVMSPRIQSRHYKNKWACNRNHLTAVQPLGDRFHLMCPNSLCGYSGPLVNDLGKFTAVCHKRYTIRKHATRACIWMPGHTTQCGRRCNSHNMILLDVVFRLVGMNQTHNQDLLLALPMHITMLTYKVCRAIWPSESPPSMQLLAL